VKNLIVPLLTSLGTPMLLMGDEMRRTQRGNNNAYCQDNEVSWLDWSLLDRHGDLHRFVRMLISHRLLGIEMGREESFGLSLNELLRRAEIDWHGVELGCPDWSDDSHSIACTVRPGAHRIPFWLHLMCNAYWEALDFELPSVPETAVAGWQRWIDTARESPEDIIDPPTAPPVTGTRYRALPRSVTALYARIDAHSGSALEIEGKTS
jgi:isoamylase